jgi:hypothetical protein
MYVARSKRFLSDVLKGLGCSARQEVLADRICQDFGRQVVDSGASPSWTPRLDFVSAADHGYVDVCFFLLRCKEADVSRD